MRQEVFDDLGRYIRATDVEGLHLMRAGSLDDSYAERIRRFDWERFHNTDPRFFASFRRELATRFSYVLIDSRTGLTDTSGICARQMPDTLVLVFVPNRQNIEGVIDVARKVKSYQVGDSLDPRAVAIFPLASRIDGDASALRDKWRKGGTVEEELIEGYQTAFEKLFADLYELDECDLTGYFDETQVSHDRDYAYGERVAARNGVTDRLSLGFAYANFTRRLTTLAGPWETLPEDRAVEEARKREADAQQATRAALATAERARRMQRGIASAAAALLVAAGAFVAFLLNDRAATPIQEGAGNVPAPANTVSPRQRFVGQTTTGSVTPVFFSVPAGPRDYYELSVTSDSLKVHASGPGFDSWAGRVGAVLTERFTAQPKTLVELSFSGVDSNGYDSAGPFDLVINPLSASDAYEPNDAIASAHSIDPALPIVANIMDRNDVDYYKFDATGVSPTVRFENRSSTLWPYITVFNADRVVVANAQAQASGTNPRLDLPAMRGLVYLAVEGRNFTSGEYTINLSAASSSAAQ